MYLFNLVNSEELAAQLLAWMCNLSVTLCASMRNSSVTLCLFIMVEKFG